MSEHECSKINVGHTLGDEEKMHDETKNFSRNGMLIKESNALTTNQYKLENSSCIHMTGKLGHKYYIINGEVNYK